MKRIFLILFILALAVPGWGANSYMGIWGSDYVERPDVQYDGILREIPTTATSTYPRLRDMGKGRDDNAVLYSGQMLDFDGTNDVVAVGDISASCKSLEITIDPASTTEGIIQLASGVSVEIDGGTVTVTGLANETVYVNGVAGTTVAAEPTVIAITFDAVSCSDVQIGYDGTAYLDGLIGNVKLWTETLTATDAAYSYANPETPAYSGPGTSLVEADLEGWWLLIEGVDTTAYDWSGNSNTGTLTDFTVPGAWTNADSLSSPFIPQTALMAWALKTSNSACVPIDTADSTNFLRTYDDLNWNGRSYADCGNGADVNPSTGMFLEFSGKLPGNFTSTSWIIDKIAAYRFGVTTSNGLYIYIYISSAAKAVSVTELGTDYEHHFIVSYEPIGHTLRLYSNALLIKETDATGNIDTNANHLFLDGSRNGEFTLGLFKLTINSEAQSLISGGASTVEKLYLKWASKKGIDNSLCLCMGDSITTGWPNLLTNTRPESFIASVHGGGTLVYTIEPAFVSDLAARKYNSCILGGGLGDILAARDPDIILAALDSEVLYADSVGVAVVACLGLTPFKNYTTWSSEKQALLEEYNTKLIAYCTTNGLLYVDMYSALDTDSDDELDATYDSGDGLHPNDAGKIKIAETIKTAMGAE